MCKKDVQIKFGTDGWRGVIADDFTFSNVRLVSQAIAQYLNHPTPNTKHPVTKVAIGFDTRFLSERFAQTVAEVLSANNISVILSDRVIPTPMVSFTVKNRKLSLGIMITASHNPPYFNGLKIKTSSGAAAGGEITNQVEAKINPDLDIPSVNNNLIKKENLSGDYIKKLYSYIEIKKIKNKKFKVLVDLMYGSGNGFIKEVLKDTGIKFAYLHSDYNPSFEGRSPEPIEENLSELKKETKRRGFAIGIALDGDADRIAACDEKGNFIHPQKILPLLLLHLIKNRGFKGGVVKTIAGSTLIDKVANKLGIKVFETPVGFKYISKIMEEEEIAIGGEEAGGIGFKNYIPERDGTLAGLLLLEMMAYKNMPISKIINEMHEEFGRYYYLREDLKLDRQDYAEQFNRLRAEKELLGRKVTKIKDFDGLKLICQDESWLMLRGSGTEPLMRVYAEATNMKRAKELLKFGRRLFLS